MALSLAPENLARYKEVAKLFWKYGRGDLISESALGGALPQDERKEIEPRELKADEFAADLERLGPLYVKLGQVLSSRGDILPPEFIQALSRLQDNIDPFPFEQVEAIIQEELGVRISKAFSHFDPTPIGAASLGQVHRARLRDGREVVVKVQRPGIRSVIERDMEALRELAQFVDAHTDVGRRHRVSEMLDEFRQNLAIELDYRKESRNLERIAENLSEFEHIVLPAPISDYTTSRVLTMEYISGRKVTELGPLASLGMDGAALAEDLFRAYLKQILIDGVFHADPHPGNVLITWGIDRPDSSASTPSIALIDLGMVGRLTSGMQEQLLKLLIAVSESRSEEAANTAVKIGEVLEDFDESAFKKNVARIIAQNEASTVEEIQIGRVLLEFTRAAGSSGIRMPSELTMLGKTLLNLDEIARVLDPEFNPADAIRRNAGAIARRRMLAAFTPGNVFASAMEAKELARETPARINQILDRLARNELKLEVETIDEQTLVEGFQKVANRITMGLVLAALVVGAALLMRVDTPYRILGYPALAMTCFLAAAAGGFALIISILFSDRVSHNHGRKIHKR